MVDTMTEHWHVRKPPLVLLDGKRIRYQSCTLAVSQRSWIAAPRHWADTSAGYVFSWVDAAGVAHAVDVYHQEPYPIVRRSGRIVTCLSSGINPNEQYAHVWASYIVALTRAEQPNG